MPITPQLEEARKATQFGKEKGNLRPWENPDANKPYSILHHMRIIAAQEFENENELKEWGRGRRSIAWRTAYMAMIKAMKGDNRSIDRALDRLDGALLQEQKHSGQIAHTHTPLTPEELADRMDSIVRIRTKQLENTNGTK